jgi:hypothetical protein
LADNVVGTGGLNGLPVLNGPINPVSNVQGMKKGLGEFVHPGLWHTHDDLERIRLGVSKGQDPWKSAYANFSLDSYSQASVSWLYQPSIMWMLTCHKVCDARTKTSSLSRALQ